MQAEGNSHKVTILAKVNRYIGIPCYDHLIPGIIDNGLHIEVYLISLYILQSAADGAMADIKDTY